jgi:hypothetical protein
VLGATAGAVALFAAARSAFGDVLRTRAGPAVGRIAEGVRTNAFSYLLTLRLLPVVPFSVLNLAAGFVDIPLRTYALSTLLGHHPGHLDLRRPGRRPGFGLRQRTRAEHRPDLRTADPGPAGAPGGPVPGPAGLEAAAEASA